MEELVRKYIESGVLELYVLGSLSLEEQREVEAMAAKHEEIKNELQEIESSMQAYAAEQAIEPSEEVRQRVLNSLITNLSDDRTFSKAVTHTNDSANVVTMPVRGVTSFYKYAFAASLVLLCLSIAALVSVYKNLQRANGQLLTLQTQNLRYSRAVQYKESQLEVYRSSSFQLITLKGMPKSPLSSITMAWSPVQKKVMVSTVHMKLPVNDTKHQYQLWALVGGKPIDLGVFDAQSDTTNKEMIEMKSIAQADAFAVTLEPRGGSASPTLNEMMVMAKL